jgi:uridine kinase
MVDSRPPQQRPYLIGLAGGTASGKTSVCELVVKGLGLDLESAGAGPPHTVLISMDSFYKPLTKEQQELAHKSMYNFDHPDAFDFDLLLDTLQRLKKGEDVEIPSYSFVTHSRLDETVPITRPEIVLFEGIFALYDERIRDQMDMKVFVDTDDDLRLARRIRRDIAERGRDVTGVLDQYERFVKPAYDNHIASTKRFADVILPRGKANKVGIEVIVNYIFTKLPPTIPTFLTRPSSQPPSRPESPPDSL